jgi:hypothetical protein
MLADLVCCFILLWCVSTVYVISALYRYSSSLVSNLVQTSYKCCWILLKHILIILGLRMLIVHIIFSGNKLIMKKVVIKFNIWNNTGQLISLQFILISLRPTFQCIKLLNYTGALQTCNAGYINQSQIKRKYHSVHIPFVICRKPVEFVSLCVEMYP